jgi:uncharacterized membrane protein YoaK (UPF0700 family)
LCATFKLSLGIDFSTLDIVGLRSRLRFNRVRTFRSCLAWQGGAVKLMLSARAYSFRQKARVAISLSWIGGFHNVVIFMLLGQVFVSHMTGAVTNFGRTLATRHWIETLPFAALLVSFYVGAACSSFLTEHGKYIGERSKYAVPLAVQAVVIAICILLFELKDQNRQLAVDAAIINLSAFAMGIQNATITKISGNVVRTTHVTGVVTDMALETVQYVMWIWRQYKNRGLSRVKRLFRVSCRHPSFLRLLVLYSILGSFIFGVMSGTLACNYFQHTSLLLPAVFLVGIVILDWRSPIASIKEIDTGCDEELSLLGLDKGSLPAEVALYRIMVDDADVTHRAPNFQLWIEHLPKTKQVVVLELSHSIKLDANAILDLEHTVEQVRERGGELILGGVSAQQYETLKELQLLDKIGAQNVCPDIEFAIARGAACVRYSNTVYMYVPVGFRRVAKVNQAIA